MWFRHEGGALQRDKSAHLLFHGDLEASEHPTKMVAQFVLFQQLLVQDSDDYNEAQVAELAPKVKKRRAVRPVPAPEDGATHDGEEASGDRQPTGTW
jgi:hypothetical protein